MATVIINIDLRSKQAKSFFNYIKTLDFVKFENKNVKTKLGNPTQSKEDFIKELSQETNKNITKKLFKKHNIVYKK